MTTEPQTERHVLDALAAIIDGRRDADPQSSYTAKLLHKGRRKIAQKVGEEGVETALAAVGEGKEQVVAESADLLYHLMVLWTHCGVAPEEVWNELRGRFGMSGIEEKNARSE